MADTDWIKAQAAKHKQQHDAEQQRRAAETKKEQEEDAIFAAQIDALWAELRSEFQNQATAFNEAFGSKDLTVTGDGNEIAVQSARHLGIKLSLNKGRKDISQQVSHGGSTVMGTPSQSFAFASGRLKFVEGTPEQLAVSLLQRMLK